MLPERRGTEIAPEPFPIPLPCPEKLSNKQYETNFVKTTVNKIENWHYNVTEKIMQSYQMYTDQRVFKSV